MSKRHMEFEKKLKMFRLLLPTRLQTLKSVAVLYPINYDINIIIHILLLLKQYFKYNICYKTAYLMDYFKISKYLIFIHR